MSTTQEANGIDWPGAKCWRNANKISRRTAMDPSSPWKWQNYFHKLNGKYNAYIDFLDQIYREIRAMRQQQKEILEQQIDRSNLIIPRIAAVGWCGNNEWKIGTGIENTALNCYAIATLQVLFHIPQFVRYQLNETYHAKQCQQQCLDK